MKVDEKRPLLVVPAKRAQTQLGVIPGRAEGASPESITISFSLPLGPRSIFLSCGYGFPGSSLRSAPE